MILRDARFHLAHEIRAHVGGLRVNAAAHTGEKRNRGRAKGEARDHRDHFCDLPALAVINEKQTGKPQHTEAHHAHAHHRAAAESDGQRGSETRAGGVSSADIGLGGHFHSYKTSQRGAQSAHDKGEPNPGAGFRTTTAALISQQQCHGHDEPHQF